MKILQILPALEMGGVERGTVEIASALAAAGIESGVVSSGGPLVAKLKKLGVRHYTLPTASKNPLVVFKNASAIARIAAEGAYTLMHVRSRAPAWSVARASRLAKIPWISTFHGVYGTEPRWLKIPYNRVMLGGSVVIAVSDYVKSHIVSVYGADPRKIIRIHRGADVEEFRPDAVSQDRAAAFKRDLGFDPGAPVVTLPGRLTRWKGQAETLHALATLGARKLGCLFVGSAQGRLEYLEYLKRIAAGLPEGMKTVFLERSDDMPLVYAISDVVLSASTGQPEAFGRVIPEAQACGRIVVGTAHGGACETIRDGETGFLVPPGDIAALGAKIEEALSLPAQRRDAMASAAVRSVRDNFSTARMCAATLEVYRRVCGEAGQ